MPFFGFGSSDRAGDEDNAYQFGYNVYGGSFVDNIRIMNNPALVSNQWIANQNGDNAHTQRTGWAKTEFMVFGGTLTQKVDDSSKGIQQTVLADTGNWVGQIPKEVGIIVWNDATYAVDWVFIRKYTSPEPTAILGAEQPVPTSTPTPTLSPTSTPVLLVSQDPFSFDFGTMNAGELSSQVFTISNNGGGTLTWGVIHDQSWITLNPTSGTNLGTVTINVNTAGLSPGSHSGTITVTANGVSKKGIIYLNIANTSIATPTPIPPSPVPLNQIMGVILVLAGLLFTALTTIKKDVHLELGVSEKTMKYVGGSGILLIMIGTYILLRSSGLI